MRHELTSGAWVEVRPIQDMKRKDKIAIARMRFYGIPLNEDLSFDKALAVAGLGSYGALDARWDANRDSAVAALVITGWSFELPPVAIENDQFVNEASLDELD